MHNASPLVLIAVGTIGIAAAMFLVLWGLRRFSGCGTEPRVAARLLREARERRIKSGDAWAPPGIDQSREPWSMPLTPRLARLPEDAVGHDSPLGLGMARHIEQVMHGANAHLVSRPSPMGTAAIRTSESSQAVPEVQRGPEA